MRIDLLDNVSKVNNLSRVHAVKQIAPQENGLKGIQDDPHKKYSSSSLKIEQINQLSPQNLEAYAKEKAKDPSAFSDPMVRMAKKIGIIECQTCANRQYQDGSNDVGVTFKNGGHISPENAFAVVNSHEQEHIVEAKERAAFDESTDFLGASVKIFVSTCPECGRTYVSGGETQTIEGHSSHSHSDAQNINLNNPSVAFYNQENQFSKNEGNLFDSVA